MAALPWRAVGDVLEYGNWVDYTGVDSGDVKQTGKEEYRNNRRSACQFRLLLKEDYMEAGVDSIEMS